uniref:Enhancer of rudimentary homolog n=2 Tax=Araucariaceae TaxID=25664 RepID=A0A0D6R333_ARACU
MANRHTIVLIQTAPNRSTRTFMDFDSITQAMDGICGLYERKLKELNPAIRNIQYDIEDLYNFIDGLADMSALVCDPSIQAYLPYDRKWIKERIFQHLRKLAVSEPKFTKQRYIEQNTRRDIVPSTY